MSLNLEHHLRKSREASPAPDSQWLQETREVSVRAAGRGRMALVRSTASGRGMRVLGRRWALAVAVGIICGAIVGAAIAASDQGTPPPPRAVDWNADFGPGSQNGSLNTAASLLSFAPVAPQGISAPTKVYVSDPNQPIDRRAVELQFNDPTYGVFRLDESLAQTTNAALLNEVTCPTGNTCPSALTVVDLNSGGQGLSIAGAASTGVEWIQGGVLYDAYGPPDTFSTNDALAVANRVVANIAPSAG